MNKKLLFTVLSLSMFVITIYSLYDISISPRNVLGYPFISGTLIDTSNSPLGSYQIPVNQSDLCSPEGTKNLYIGGYGSKTTLPCLEQINLKLDKLISLEEKEIGKN